MTQKQCADCGHLNPEAAAFCAECGKPLAPNQPCSNCGFSGNPPAAAFCGGCGTALGRPALRSPWLKRGLVGLGIIGIPVAVGLVLWQTGVLGMWIGDGLPLPIAVATATATPATAEEAEAAEDMGPSTVAPAEDVSFPTEPPSDQQTATVSPADTAAPDPTTTPDATATPQPATTPLPTSTPAPTVPPSPTPCGINVRGALYDAWQSHESVLDCPTSAGGTIWMAQEEFQRGRMLWREDNDKIYVIYSGGRWERYDDIWLEGDPEFSCGIEQSPPTPKRGFGKIWCTYDNVRQVLGDATTGEWGADGVAQDFSGGTIIQTASGATFVLYYDGTWR